MERRSGTRTFPCLRWPGTDAPEMRAPREPWRYQSPGTGPPAPNCSGTEEDKSSDPLYSPLWFLKTGCSVGVLDPACSQLWSWEKGRRSTWDQWNVLSRSSWSVSDEGFYASAEILSHFSLVCLRVWPFLCTLPACSLAAHCTLCWTYWRGIYTTMAKGGAKEKWGSPVALIGLLLCDVSHESRENRSWWSTGRGRAQDLTAPLLFILPSLPMNCVFFPSFANTETCWCWIWQKGIPHHLKIERYMLYVLDERGSIYTATHQICRLRWQWWCDDDGFTP